MSQQGRNPDWTDSSIPYEQRVLLAEMETCSKVSSCISCLESAIEAWNAAGRKPESIRTTMAGFQQLLAELNKWERESLRGRNSQDLAAREMRLRLFVNLCRKYGHLGNFGNQGE